MNNIELADYSSFDTLDFFSDENFIRYVLQPQPADIAYWTEVLVRYPAQKNAIEEAEGWIMMLNTQAVYTPPARNSEQAWGKIQTRMQHVEHRKRTIIIPLRQFAKWSGAVAAIFLLCLGISELMQQGQQVFHSAYGQLRTVTLPDESVATLNGNSRIYYVRNWRSDKPRELWMEGEASFKVKHVAILNRVQQADSFRVHVNGIDLTVLGTQFNVKNRRGKTEISLVQGSLRIDKSGMNAFSRMMKPGDVFVYDGNVLHKGLQQRTARASQSWTRKELDLDGYTLGDIAQILEDTYGYKVTLNAADLSARKLSGTIPLGSADDILFVIEKVFNVSIIKNKNQLLINHKTN